jgi:hypothetical protein
MSEYSNVEITDTEDLGVILHCKDVEVADGLEDFLTERCFVLFNIRPQGAAVSFYFGQASSREKVRQLYERFLVDGKQ